MFYRRSPHARKQPAPAAPPPATPGGLVAEFQAKPFTGTGSGEWISGRPAGPRTEQPAQRPFTIEPPPWKTDPVAAAAPADHQPVLPVGALGAQALAELKAQDGNTFDPPSPLALRGPPVRNPPLLPPQIPPWPEAQRRADLLAAERAAQGIHEEQPSKYPPARRETL